MSVRNTLIAATLGLGLGFGAAAPAFAADIVDTAKQAGTFNTLLAAATAAGLADTLKGPGPYTVLAPTDAAFAALPAGTVDNLLKPENKDKLVQILKYHVIAGDFPAAKVATLTQAPTLEGDDVKISAMAGKVKIDDANVVKADVKADNGVIHVIDKVLMPSG